MLTNRRIVHLGVDACIDSYYKYGIICGDGPCLAKVATIEKCNSLAQLYCGDGVGVLVFRGTDDMEDWAENVFLFPGSPHVSGAYDDYRPFKPNCRPIIHAGFYGTYKRLAANVKEAISEFDAPGMDWIFTGHSLGGAVASIAILSIDYVAQPYLVTFGSPRWGNKDAGWMAVQRTSSMFRFRNGRDIVPLMPSPVLSWKHPCPEIQLKGNNWRNPITAHSIEDYRAGLVCYTGG
jgi:hypothetical protein